MKILKYFIIIFISLTTSIKADLNKKIINQIKEGGKLIFIRHAYAPGGGDPINFNLKDCSTQRNLNDEGRKQAKKIGKFSFHENLNITYFKADALHGFFGNGSVNKYLINVNKINEGSRIYSDFKIVNNTYLSKINISSSIILLQKI